MQIWWAARAYLTAMKKSGGKEAPFAPVASQHRVHGKPRIDSGHAAQLACVGLRDNTPHERLGVRLPPALFGARCC
jgi:hypothetical protein